VITFFEIKDSYYSSAVRVGPLADARRGDYMPVNDKNHSTMLLGIEAATSTVWTWRSPRQPSGSTIARSSARSARPTVWGTRRRR
jgi:hypothetical protein